MYTSEEFLPPEMAIALDTGRHRSNHSTTAPTTEDSERSTWFVDADILSASHPATIPGGSGNVTPTINPTTLGTISVVA